MTNAAKASVWDVIYTPWGSLHSATGARPLGSPLEGQTLNTRFPGQWFQLESALHYNWHRHYDPSLGRYTQPDPLGFVDGPSVYAYAGNSPQRYVDKDGRFIRIAPPPNAIPRSPTIPRTPTPNPTPTPPGLDPKPPFPLPTPRTPKPGEICRFDKRDSSRGEYQCKMVCPSGAEYWVPANSEGECDGFHILDLVKYLPYTSYPQEPNQCSIRQ